MARFNNKFKKGRFLRTAHLHTMNAQRFQMHGEMCLLIIRGRPLTRLNSVNGILKSIIVLEGSREFC